MQKPIAFGAVIFFMSRMGLAQEVNLLELAQIDAASKEIGCTPLNQKSSGVMPWAIRGYRDAKDVRNEVTVFWCAKSDREFVLIFEASGKLMKGICPAYINWDIHPRGLRLNYESQPLSSFDGSELEKRVGVTSGAVIEDGDSSISSFFCYKGKWLTKVSD